MSNNSPQQTYNQYKIRKITWNKFGDTYGITIPRALAEQFLEVKFNIEILGNDLILKSGLDLVQLKKDILNNKVNLNTI